MDEQERANDELVTRFCKEWDAPYLTTEAMAPYFTDDAVYHNIPLPPIEGGAAIAGMLGGGGAPDEERGSKNLGWVVHNQAANGDVVLNERTDSFEVAGQRWDVPVCGVFVIRDGKIARWSDYFRHGPHLAPPPLARRLRPHDQNGAAWAAPFRGRDDDRAGG